MILITGRKEQVRVGFRDAPENGTHLKTNDCGLAINGSWVKVLGAKPDGPSLIPGTLMEEGENQLFTDAMASSPYPYINE